MNIGRRVSVTDSLGLEVFGLYLGLVLDDEEFRG